MSLYGWLARHLHCCGCGCFIPIAAVAAIGTAGTAVVVLS